MNSRSKVVEFNCSKFEVRRLLPDVGSFIFMKMMGLSLRARSADKERGEEPSSEAPTATSTPVSGETQVRALAFSVFAGGIPFEDFKFIQNACIQSVSKQRPDTGLYMPVMTDSGRYTKDGEELETNVGLVMNLTTEVLVLCFADFFDNSGAGQTK